MDFSIQRDDPNADDVRALLSAHLTFANEHSPPEHVHALDVSGLCTPDVSFFSARDNQTVLGVGALKRLDTTHAEIKSMHTAASARGRGVGRAIVEHLLAFARVGNYVRVSLETGTMEAFAPARELYRTLGFETCAPFEQYSVSDYSTCMTLRLAESAPPR